MYSFEACYKIKIKGKEVNKKCKLKNGKFRELEKEPGGFAYEINIPRRLGKKYPSNKFCKFSFPAPQSWNVYLYVFENGKFSFEQNNSIPCRCHESLLFEHMTLNANGVSPASILSCGNQIDGRVDGKVLIDNITITFRSNEQVQKKGTQFFISEYTVQVCKLVSMVPPGSWVVINLLLLAIRVIGLLVHLGREGCLVKLVEEDYQGHQETEDSLVHKDLKELVGFLE